MTTKTTKSSEKLALALETRGFAALAARARENEFSDFNGPHAMPQHVLIGELSAIKDRSSAARELIQMTMDGDFDAGLEESDDWAASPDGQAAFEQLVKGK